MDFWAEWRESVRMDPFEHIVSWTIGFLSATAVCSVIVILFAIKRLF